MAKAWSSGVRFPNRALSPCCGLLACLLIEFLNVLQWCGHKWGQGKVGMLHVSGHGAAMQPACSSLGEKETFALQGELHQ